MKKLSLVILALGTLAGCAKEGKLILDSAANNCENSGYTFTVIHYGDSRLVVLPLSEIGRGYEWRFHLVPQQDSPSIAAIKEAEVTITGGSNATWLNTSGKYNTGSVISICVPMTAPTGEPPALHEHVAEPRPGDKRGRAQLVRFHDPLVRRTLGAA